MSKENTKMKWWEKTVEYMFVKKHLPIDTMVAALDGYHELLGDVLLQRDKKWAIIEFKADKKSINTEKGKFYDYEAASKELSEHDSHHFIVYGAMKENLTLGLCGVTYFSQKVISSIEIVLNAGLDKESFVKYLDRFLHHKNGGAGGGSGGSVLTPDDYALVVGITGANEIVECMTLQEFGLTNGFKYDVQKTFNKGHSRDSDLSM